MHRRRIIAFLLLIAVLVSACTSCKLSHSESNDSGASGMLFWEVSDAEGHVLYLFGSIHVGESSLYPLPKVIRDAYDAADLLAVEVDVLAMEQDLALMNELSQMMIYTDGTTIADHLPADLYEDAREAMAELGYDLTTIDYMHPAVWTSVLDAATAEACGLSDDGGVDRHLLEQAHDDGKEIYELESARMQYEMLVGFSDELSALLLRSSLEDRDGQIEALKTMYETYRSGDFAGFSACVAEAPTDLTEEEALLYAEYVKTMVDDRNVHMLEQALELLASGEVCLYVVGAAHMVGETGLVAALESAGCTVEPR